MDVQAGAGASWSGESWEPVDVPGRHHEVEVLRFERALARGYPALSRLLGAEESEALARELVATHPFLPGSDVDLDEVLEAFLPVALEDDRQRGAWLAELAVLEAAVAAVRRKRPAAHDELDGGRLLAFEHRVDELRDQLLAEGAWREPAPQPVVLAVVGGAGGPRCVELEREPVSGDRVLTPERALGLRPRDARATPPRPSAA
jgi:hypothetical protein